MILRLLALLLGVGAGLIGLFFLAAAYSYSGSGAEGGALMLGGTLLLGGLGMSWWAAFGGSSTPPEE